MRLKYVFMLLLVITWLVLIKLNPGTNIVIRLLPAAVVALVLLLIWIILKPTKVQKIDKTLRLQTRHLVNGNILVIPGGNESAGWECNSFKHSLTYTKADGSVHIIYIATIESVLGQKQAISINGRRPPGDDWTSGTIEDVTGDYRGVHIIIQDNQNKTSMVLIPWPEQSSTL